MTNLAFHWDLDEKTKLKCENCEWAGGPDDLDEICDVQERISAGEVVPAGQCPNCQGLVYVPERRAEPSTIAVLRRLVAAFPEFGTDEPLDGGDCVERLADIVYDARAVLNHRRPQSDWLGEMKRGTGAFLTANGLGALLEGKTAPSDRAEVIAHAVRALACIARTVEGAGKIADTGKRHPSFVAADWRDIAKSCATYARHTLAEMGKMVGLFTPETNSLYDLET